MSFLGDLKRRNVIRIAAGYIVAAWLVVPGAVNGQAARPIFPVKSITGRRGKMEELAPSFLLAIGAGVLVTLVTSKRCELTPGIGIEGQALKKYNRLNEQ